MRISNENNTNPKYHLLQDCGASLVGIGAGYEFRKYFPRYVVKPLFEREIKYTRTNDKQNEIIMDKLQIIHDKINKGIAERNKIKLKYIDENFKTNNSHIEAVKKGLNASFISKNRTVYLNKNLVAPGFHELAHAKDFLSGFLPKMQITEKYLGRTFGVILPIFAVCTKTKQEKPNKSLSSIDKTINFIRNNAGKLTFLAIIPKITAEASANYQGNKFAKEVKLPNEILKIVKRTHRLSNISYFIGGLSLALSSTIAVKTKDLLASKFN